MTDPEAVRSGEETLLLAAVAEVIGNAWCGNTHHFDVEASAILAMPEMQAIRQLLWVLNSDMEAERVDGYRYTDAHDEWHRIRSTSPALAEWVRSNP